MRLLICTQVLDSTHPVLGFVHKWIETFSNDFESITVICLQEGEHALPDTVSVYSLGKEEGEGNKIKYAVRFWHTLRKLRGTYDAVLVHMNPEYVFLGQSEWRSVCVPTALWYNHNYGGWKLKVAATMVGKVLYTSSFSAGARIAKSVQMPAGIDTSLFVPTNTAKKENSIYFQGRIAPAKRIHILLQALRVVQKTIPTVSCTLVGPIDPVYFNELQAQFSDLIESGVVTFEGPVPYVETPERYAQHTVSVNLTAAGNFDKSVLESIACGTPTIVSSPAFASLIPAPYFFEENNAESLAQTLEYVLSLSKNERDEMAVGGRREVEQKHSLQYLGSCIRKELSV